MSADQKHDNCTCKTCRVRAFVKAEFQSEGYPEGFVDTGKALEALADISSELLAHESRDMAKAWTRFVLEMRAKWKTIPHVKVQQTVGNA